MNKKEIKCENGCHADGSPVYRYKDKDLCTICMFDLLRNNGYICESDVPMLGFSGEKNAGAK